MKFTLTNLSQTEKKNIADLLALHTMFSHIDPGAATQTLVQQMGAALRDEKLSLDGVAYIVMALFDEELDAKAEAETERQMAEAEAEAGHMSLTDLLLMLG